jgi:precorrin-6B C5,15-methyltransferase / cobalt-precorrin-6B C5,C15-methyltransferase
MRMSSPLASIEPRETTPRRWLSIVGIGEDGVAGLSSVAKSLVESAELVVGGTRHLKLAGKLIRGETLSWPSPLDEAFPEILRRRGRSVAVLATGDPFNFGVGKQLAGLVSADEILCLPQPSAFSLAASRMGWALQDVACVTLHGRALEGIIRHLQPGARILALSWDGTTPAKLAALIASRGFETSRVTVLESMGGPNERVRSQTAGTFSLSNVGALNTLAIEIVAGNESRVMGLAPGLNDDLFEHDGQLTKREVRALTLSSLAPRRGELLWDIGLGAGSIAIEWLLCDASLLAIGIEERADRAERAMRNALVLGAPDLKVVIGLAPNVLVGLPAPDAVFIGGGLTDPGVFDAAWAALKPGGRLVTNAITIESEGRLAELFSRHGGELTRIAVARADSVGGMHGWRPAMPVAQWRVRKP